MTLPTIQTVPIGSLVMIAWLSKIVGNRVSRSLPGTDEAPDLAKISNGFVVVTGATTSGDIKRQTSAVVECYAAPAKGSKVAWNEAEELGTAIWAYVARRPLLRDRIELPFGRGSVLVTSPTVLGPDLIEGDLGGLARADLSISLKWRPLQ